VIPQVTALDEQFGTHRLRSGRSSSAAVQVHDRVSLESSALRDSESLLALEWSTAWLRTAERYLGDKDIQVVKTKRTRAHVLQLHGFLAVAGSELDATYRAMAHVYVEREYRDAETVDLLLRHTSVDIAAGGGLIEHSKERLTQAFELMPKCWAAPRVATQPVPIGQHSRDAKSQTSDFWRSSLV